LTLSETAHKQKIKNYKSFATVTVVITLFPVYSSANCHLSKS